MENPVSPTAKVAIKKCYKTITDCPNCNSSNIYQHEYIPCYGIRAIKIECVNCGAIACDDYYTKYKNKFDEAKYQTAVSRWKDGKYLEKRKPLYGQLEDIKERPNTKDIKDLMDKLF